MLIERIEDGFQATIPCKLNLWLEVIGKRPDGYHELDTTMIAVSLCDRLAIVPNQTGTWTLDVRFMDRFESHESDPAWNVPNDASNLVLKALRRWTEQHGIKDAGANVVLTKGIPSMAGLGGGSADAAAALILALLLWPADSTGSSLSTAGIESLARVLGSDINFFLEGRNTTGVWAARCRGRGEVVTPIEVLGDCPFVIVHPPQGCGTADVFRNYSSNQGSDRRIEPLLDAVASGQWSLVGKLLRNDLEQPASRVTEWISRAGSWIDRYDHLGQVMTGSGSARFCLCASMDQAEKIAREIRNQNFARAYAVQLWRQPSLVDQLEALRKSR